MGKAKDKEQAKASAFERMILEGIAGWEVNDIREQPNVFLTGGLTMWSRLIEHPALRQHVVDLITVVRERLDALELLQELAMAEDNDGKQPVTSARVVQEIMGDDTELPVGEVIRRLRERGYIKFAEAVAEGVVDEVIGNTEGAA